MTAIEWRRKCKTCRGEFVAGRDRRVYCSDECQPLHLTKEFDCEECGVRFERRSDHRPRNQTGRVLCRTCSSRAAATGRRYPARRTGRLVICTQCGAEVYQTPSDQTLGRKKFCGRECHIAWARDNGASQPSYKAKKAKHVPGDHIAKPRVRAAVAARDGDECLLCGRTPPGLHLHRVIYGAQGGRYEVPNCVQLCVAHHGAVHESKRVWGPVLTRWLAGDGDRRVLRELAISMGLPGRRPFAADNRGERNGRAVLTQTDADRIRALYAVKVVGPPMRTNVAELAGEFGVSTSTIKRVVNRETFG